MDLIGEIKKQNIFLTYNSNDPCCFDSQSASLFEREVISKNMLNVKFIIHKSSKHDYNLDYLYENMK